MQPPQPWPHLPQVLALLRWLLILLFVVVGYAVLSYLAHVLAPILAALGIAYLLNPVLEALVCRGVSRSVGAGFLLVSFLGLLVAALVLAVPAIAEQVRDFVDDLPRMVANLSSWLERRFGVEVPHEWRQYATSEHLQQV